MPFKNRQSTPTGDVVGPASAVDDNIAVFDSTTGKLIKDGGNTIAEVLDTDNHTDGTTTKVFQLQDRENITTGAKTGIVSGGAITINGGDNTTFDMASFESQFIDHTAGTITIVTGAGFTAVTPTIVSGDTVADVFLESNGTLSYAFGLSFEDERNKIVLARTGVPGGQGTQIFDIFPKYQVSIDTDLSSRDALDIIAPIMNIGGNNVYTANGANLSLNKSTGSVFQRGSNFVNNIKDPDQTTTPADTLVSFRTIYRDGTGGFIVSALTTTIDPDFYDDGSGTLQAVSNNKFTVPRISLAVNNLTLIEYGQKEYANLNDAKLDVGTSGHIQADPNILLRAGLVVKKGTTDLTVAADAEFVLADELGKLGGGGSTAASGIDLQTSYNQSVQPQIVTTALLGAVQIQRGSAADTDAVFEILNGAGTTTVSIDGNGLLETASNIELGHATDTTLARVSAGVVSIEGVNIVTTTSTDTLTNKTIDANGTGNSISNIDVADLANGTDGELITWDNLGAPATVAVGTATHVLTSNGVGVAPTFQAAAAGGSSTNLQYPHSKTGLTALGKRITDTTTYTPTTGKVAYILDANAEGTIASTLTRINSIVIGELGFFASSGYTRLINPLILNDTDVLSSSSTSNISISGFEVAEDANITPITTSGTYTVPASKVYVILNYYSTTTTLITGAFTIGGTSLNHKGSSNDIQTDLDTITSAPMILDAGDSVDSASINHTGYLVSDTFIS